MTRYATLLAQLLRYLSVFIEIFSVLPKNRHCAVDDSVDVLCCQQITDMINPP